MFTFASAPSKPVKEPGGSNPKNGQRESPKRRSSSCEVHNTRNTYCGCAGTIADRKKKSSTALPLGRKSPGALLRAAGMDCPSTNAAPRRVDRTNRMDIRSEKVRFRAQCRRAPPCHTRPLLDASALGPTVALSFIFQLRCHRNDVGAVRLSFGEPEGCEIDLIPVAARRGCRP